MRLACGGVLLVEAITHPVEPLAFESVMRIALSILFGFATLLGYKTRIAGAGAASVEVWSLARIDDNALAYSLVATLGAAIALLGPGAWSVDAYHSGWRRIDIPGRRS